MFEHPERLPTETVWPMTTLLPVHNRSFAANPNASRVDTISTIGGLAVSCLTLALPGLGTRFGKPPKLREASTKLKWSPTHVHPNHAHRSRARPCGLSQTATKLTIHAFMPTHKTHQNAKERHCPKVNEPCNHIEQNVYGQLLI